jgi:hypothetical protein
MKYYISLAFITIFCIVFGLIKYRHSSDFVITPPNNFTNKLGSNYGILIISEAGCIACNKEYFNFILDNAVNKDNIIIYSTASGMRLDISPFIGDTIHNLIDNKQNILDKLNLEDGSYFIDINKNKVDTIIPINVFNINQSLDYIKTMRYFK